jgi:hypothetical protein
MAPKLGGPVGPMLRRRDLPEAKRKPARPSPTLRRAEALRYLERGSRNLDGAKAGRFAKRQTRDAAFTGSRPLHAAPCPPHAVFMGQGEPRLVTQ